MFLEPKSPSHELNFVLQTCYMDTSTAKALQQDLFGPEKEKRHLTTCES